MNVFMVKYTLENQSGHSQHYMAKILAKGQKEAKLAIQDTYKQAYTITITSCKQMEWHWLSVTQIHPSDGIIKG